MSDQKHDEPHEILRDLSEKHEDQPGDLGKTKTDAPPRSLETPSEGDKPGDGRHA
ncbi:hypothetical protein [Rhizosaccharibacter radicis]|uniref:Uncharacterized protein n=1 Tax=Rhizosaccharibacter radicis TaxID=2782605 RepID=A0ABT1VSF7_9PROT|nr:hypothetical protein [Acetobacteraceae bacterium KSS12]